MSTAGVHKSILKRLMNKSNLLYLCIPVSFCVYVYSSAKMSHYYCDKKKKNPGQYVILSSISLHTVILGQTKNDKLDPYVQVFFSLFFYLFIFLIKCLWKRVPKNAILCQDKPHTCILLYKHRMIKDV